MNRRAGKGKLSYNDVVLRLVEREGAVAFAPLYVPPGSAIGAVAPGGTCVPGGEYIICLLSFPRSESSAAR
jgi:hypothetical protein